MPAAVSTATVSHGHHVAVTRMPPPWDPDEGETEETRIMPRADEEPTRLAPPPPEARTVVRTEEEPVPPPGPGRQLWPWLLLLLGLVLALLAAVWWFSQDDNDEPPAAALRPVPSVVRLAVSDAQRVLEAQGFQVEVQRKASDEAPEGVVFAQQPEAGAEVAEGSVVTVTASSGPATAEVPDVVGRTRDQAVQALEQADLRATTANVPSNASPGTVVAQSPAAGQRVDVGSSVRINVSGGPGAVTVPDVVGASADDAAAELQSAGLKAQTTAVASDEARGTVVTQSPAAGADAARGSTVRLEVSSGPQPVAVPDVVDQTEADARDALEARGFRVRVVEESSPDPESVGLVLRQVPAAGREAPPGAQVTIVVGV